MSKKSHKSTHDKKEKSKIEHRDRNRSISDSKSSWCKHAKYYDPIKVGSIDGTDTEPHDHGIVRALNSVYSINERIVGDPNKTVFVGRLHRKTDEKTLRRKFRKCGKIKRYRLVRDIITGISKCYGFIEFETHSDAEYAVHKMNKKLIDNCEIIVEYEMERTLANWKPRRLGGGFGGQRESGQLRFGCRSRPFQQPIEITPLSSHHR